MTNDQNSHWFYVHLFYLHFKGIIVFSQSTQLYKDALMFTMCNWRKTDWPYITSYYFYSCRI